MPSMIEPKVLLDGIVIGESPRWHDRLWFAHWGTGQIVTVDLDGTSESSRKSRSPGGAPLDRSPSLPLGEPWRSGAGL